MAYNKNKEGTNGVGRRAVLLRRIEKYLRATGMAPTRFGREAVRDPRFVLDLRRGREPGGAVSRRVAAFLDKRESQLEARRCGS